ncbi:hypothetical protein BJV82DRAFT_614970 [Fennellomyces sp. T-0311]|nr:hypothetical protein BJV82DRAFT_614970 [Fennellomyces sp. T-0311]
MIFPVSLLKLVINIYYVSFIISNYPCNSERYVSPYILYPLEIFTNNFSLIIDTESK